MTSTTIAVNQAITTTNLTSTPNPANFGENVTLTATVTSSGDTVPGTVGFFNGAAPIPGCTEVALSAGTANCNTASLPAGTLSLSAEYAGTGTYLASRGTTSQIVRAPDALVLVTPAVPEGVVNVPYAATVQASGGLLPYSFSATGLPPGMTMSNNGVLSGTPTTSGTNDLTVSVTDAQGQVQTRNYPLTRGTTLVIATTSLSNGLIGAPYSQTFAGLGGQEPYTWTLASGALPSGLNLDPASGQLTGTPATVGTSAFTVQVTDSAGRNANQAFTLTRTTPSFIRPDPTDELVSGDIESPPDAGCVLNQEQTQIVPAGEGPTGISFPNGLLQFELNGCTPGTQLTVNLAYPETLPATTQYWKYGPTPDNATAHWYVLPGAIIVMAQPYHL